MRKTNVVKPRTSEIISDRMEEKGVSIKELSEKIGSVYEHTRRIVRGEGPPSRFLLKAICDYLKLPYKELLDAYNADKIQAKYGDLPYSIAGKKPSMQPLERVWDNLSESQQQDIISMAQVWAKHSHAGKV